MSSQTSYAEYIHMAEEVAHVNGTKPLLSHFCEI
jgi:hypothetical protein